MTYSELLAFQQWCYVIAGIAAVVCVHSLIVWQAREMLDRIAARVATRKGQSHMNGGL